jgi:sugar phosphate isomerase/epimerase
MALATKPGRAEPIVSRHHPVGASTGYMGDLRGDWTSQIGLALEVSPFAVELSALSEPELPSLSEFLSSGRSLPFRYISIHGPSKALQGDEERLVEELMQLARYANAVVMHPDTIENPALFRPLGHKLLLENMDARKKTGRNRAELESMFAELPQAGFCFDVPHAWSIDPDMSVAGELLDGFGNRLRHVHLSSLSEDLHHMPLSVADEGLFHPTLERCLDVPWIFEAPPRGLA